MTGWWWWVALLEADDLVLVLLLLSLKPSILQKSSSGLSLLRGRQFPVELRPGNIIYSLENGAAPCRRLWLRVLRVLIVIICHFLSFSVISSARSGRTSTVVHNRMEDNKQETRRNTSRE